MVYRADNPKCCRIKEYGSNDWTYDFHDPIGWGCPLLRVTRTDHTVRVIVVDHKGPLHCDVYFDGERIFDAAGGLDRRNIGSAAKFSIGSHEPAPVQETVSPSRLQDTAPSGDEELARSRIKALHEIKLKVKRPPRSWEELRVGMIINSGEKCVPPNTEIITDRGILSAQDVNVGDRVLTHRGHFRKILKVFSRHYEGKLVSIKAHGYTDPIQVTSEHPILVAVTHHRGGSWPTRKWVKAEELENLLSVNRLVWVLLPRIKTSSYKNHLNLLCHADLKKDFHVIDGFLHSISKKGFKQSTNPIRAHVEINGDLMRLFGYYIAEGSADITRGLSLAFSKDQQEYVDDTVKIITNSFGFSKHYIRRYRNCIQVQFHSTILARLFLSLFGKGARKKDIPHWFLLINKDMQKELLLGMFRGDGTQQGNTASISTCSKNLVHKIKFICLRLGIKASINITRRRGSIEYRAIFKLNKEAKNALHKEAMAPKWSLSRLTKSYLYQHIQKVETIPYSGTVYNFKVDKDETYSLANLVVHNCGIAEHSTYFLDRLKLSHFKAYTAKDTNLFQVANSIIADGVDVLHIQHEFSLLNSGSLAQLIKDVKAVGVSVILDMHTVTPSPETEELVGLADKVVIHNPEAKVYDASKTEVIPLATPVPEDIGKTAARERFHVDGGPVIASFGFVNPSKGFMEVLNAVKDLKREYPDIRYLLVGSVHPKNDQRAFLSELHTQATWWSIDGNVMFFSEFYPIETVINILQAADVLCLFYKGSVYSSASSSGPARICLAAHRPLIVSGTPTFSEFGDSVLRTEAGNTLKLTETIRQLLKDEGRQKALVSEGDKFLVEINGDSIARRFEAIYRQLGC